LVSAGGELNISAKPEVSAASSGDVVYVDVAIADARDIVEMNADTKLTASVENGELLAFGSANPCTEEAYTSGSFTTYYGRAQAVVRAGEAGVMEIKVSANGFKPATAQVTIV
jgi:hypothetical protein